MLIKDLFQLGDPVDTPDEEIAQILKRPIEYREGIFNVQIWGGAFHPVEDKVAWIDFYEDKESIGWKKDNYYLRILADGTQTLEWEVETYNPFFGAWTLYMHWHGDKLIYIYSEKHFYYGIEATTTEIKKRVKLGVIGSPIHVIDNIVRIIPYERNYEGFIDQYQLPDWTLLDPLPEAKAREMGLLEVDAED